MHDVRVRAAYERTPRVPRQTSLTINRMRGFPKKGFIYLLSLSQLCLVFRVRSNPKLWSFWLKSRRPILLPRFPRIPRKISFPRRNSARFSTPQSSNYQVSSYPLRTLFKYILNVLYSFWGGIQVNTRLKSCETPIFCYTFHTIVLTIL